MRNTPLDTLLHNAIQFQKSSPLYKEFYNVLSQHPLCVINWKEWFQQNKRVHLDKVPKNIVDIPENNRPHFCLFSNNQNIFGKQYYRPTVVSAAEGFEAIWPETQQWKLNSILVYIADDSSFDVIGLLEHTKTNAILPEVQLNFKLVENGFNWAKSSTGFINPFIYQPVIATFDENTTTKFDDAINHYGNCLSLYLGTFVKWLQQDGAWKIYQPKKAKAKYGKKGKVKKFYKLASSGYIEFTPENTNTNA